MKTIILPVAILFTTIWLMPTGTAQDSTEKAVKKAKEAAKSPEVKSILNDPRLRNMVRTVRENPDNAVKSIKDNPDEAVRAATSLFQEQLNKNGKTVDAMTKKAEKAVDKIATDSDAPTAAKPAAEEMPAVKRGTIPPAATRSPSSPLATRSATRSAVAAAKSPAMPVPGNSSPASLAPNAGLVETASPARPVEPGFSPSLLAMAGSVPAVIPDAPALSADKVPGPKSLEPKYAASTGTNTYSKGSRVITSRKSVMDDKNRIITFTGDVYMKDDTNRVTMKCDKLQIFLTAKDAKVKDLNGKVTPVSKAIATGGMVEIRKVAPGGKVQTALARRIDYNAITQDAMLSGGPPSMKDGGSSVETSSEDSKILLRGNGKYEILGTERHTIVVPITNGKKLSKDLDSSGNPLN